ASEPGDIVHVDGRVLGRHDGIMHYTIGQRRGLKLAGGTPLYVVRLDPERRQVIVGPREALRTDVLELRNVNWLGSRAEAAAARDGLPIRARIRSTHTPVEATLVLDEALGRARVLLPEGEHGVAPGQACVFYDDAGPEARVLGGGWITRTKRAIDEDASRTMPRSVAAGLAT